MVVRTRGTSIPPQGGFVLSIWGWGGNVSISIADIVQIGGSWGLLSLLPLVSIRNMGGRGGGKSSSRVIGGFVANRSDILV
jgi:hypothetical protein